MRHLIGVALAIVLAAAVFFGASWGYDRLLLRNSSHPASAVVASGGSLIGNSTVTLGIAAVAVVGLLAGLLLAIRWVSPLAPGLPGLALVAWTVLYLVSPARALAHIPLSGHSFGAGFEALGTTGILGAAGLALIVPLFIPSRWRSAAADGDDDYENEAPASSYDRDRSSQATITTQAPPGLLSDWRGPEK